MAITRCMGPRRKWARARCMEITPPRCPRARRGLASFGTLSPLAGFSRRSKLPEESKASSTSRVKWTVVGVSYQIEAPVCAHPLAPSNGESLTLEISERHSWPNELICLLAKTSTNRDVVLLVSSLSHGHETCWREDGSGIADVEADSFFKNPRLCKVISAA